ncbi:MAG: hypothetical protein HOH95_07530 [Dehalococcoidia bacterium]|jgi:hypothetical protein|nr:hypothetical protein [Dehalococcoidia bacterium]
MQQPISFPDESEDVPYADESGNPDQPLPDPASPPSAEQVPAYTETPDSDDPTPFHAVSQREMLMAEHRARAQAQLSDTSPESELALDSIDFDEDILAFPGAEPDTALPGGTSQREIIMQQQRDIVLRQAGIDPAQHSEPAPEASEATSGRWLTRRSAWATLVISLSLLLISGGVAATTETRSLDQVAGALTPDIVERWLSENISTFGDSSTPVPADAASNAAAPSATAVDAPASIAQPLRAQIANTAGAGVSIRAICINEARTADTLAEGAAVRVIGRGVGDCSGWSVVRAGAKTSWIENRFLAAAAVR